MSNEENKLRLEMHPVVFPVSAAMILLFVALSALYPGRAMLAFSWLQSAISQNFGWLYILSMSGFLVFAIYLCLSKYGTIRLGHDDQEPEFNRLTWFAMLFSAGMGIGMLFFGVAEPMFHYLNPPLGRGESLDAARRAMGTTLFHWCLHPWALYALVGLALAYFGFRRDLPLSFRSVFYPLLGERVHGWPGHIIDVLAVCATLFGLATSLGLGAKQVNAGLYMVFGLPQSTLVQVVLIAIITSMAVASLVSGLHAGIRRLSEINMILAACLLVFLFVAGPTVFLMNSLVENIGTYLQTLPINSFWTATFEGESRASWFSSWTVFYWGWWIAWSPFVGMFIARISKGRTVREFITGVLLVPSAVAIVWMTGFGNTALHQEIHNDLATPGHADYSPRSYPVLVTDETHGLPQTADGTYMVAGSTLVQDDGDGGLVAKDGTPLAKEGSVWVNASTGDPYYPGKDAQFNGTYMAEQKKLTLGGFLSEPVVNDARTSVVDTTSTAMFFMLRAYPLAKITAIIATLSVILFFVTSSDSASMVADIIASGGKETPAIGTRLFWGILEGVLAAVLLVAGGLKALQIGSITVGLPFCVIIILMCFSLYRGLHRDHHGVADNVTVLEVDEEQVEESA